MSLSFIYYIALAICGFGLSRTVLHFFQKDKPGIYSIKKDVWLYLFSVIAFGMTGIKLFGPVQPDFVVPFYIGQLLTWLGLAFLIYIVFLFEINKLTVFTIIASATAVTAMIPSDVLIFEGLMPFWFDRAAVVALVSLFTFGVSLLNGMDGILGIQIVGIGVGFVGIAFLSGLPLLFGMFGSFLTGIWLAYQQLNSYPSSVCLHDGACLSIGFILACLLLRGTVELAGPSMLILSMYVWVELVWVFVSRYILRKKTTDYYENTGYWSIFQREIEIPSINFGVAKVLILNVLLALFQLYASNGFSMPFFAFIVDVWFLYVMYRSPTENLTLKEVNREFIKNIKESILDLRNIGKKDKK